MSEPKDILILFAHPAYSRSLVQKALRRAVADMKNITIHDLYTHYPDFIVDPDKEQALLLAHDIIIFQHPYYWYSTPSILKEWQDIVLENHFAFGSGGKYLKDKDFFHVISTGAAIEQYETGVLKDTSFKEVFTPTRLMARLTQMHWHPPFIVDGIIQQDARLEQACTDYRRILFAMQEGYFDFNVIDQHDYMNNVIDDAINLPEGF